MQRFDNDEMKKTGKQPRSSLRYCYEHCSLGARHVCASQEDMFHILAETLVCALDLREHETGLHSKRVACHTMVIARHFTTDTNLLHQIYCGALLHDIGKIGISDAILLKATPLTEIEWMELRTHPQKGYNLISRIPGISKAANIILYHQEHYDGSDYPKGVRSNQIPLGALIFMIIDTLDSITSDRPYRKANSFDFAKAEIQRMKGSQFDPEVVDIFIKEEEELRRMVNSKCYNSPII